MEGTSLNAAHAVASRVALSYAACADVEAVALSGSQVTQWAEQSSDIDLYVYVNAELAIEERRQIALASSKLAEVDNQFWEPGDEWVDEDTGIHVDVMFRRPHWIEEQLERVLDRHEASVGYSTCFWHNVQSSRILYDKAGWYATLHEKAQQEYPELLQRHIIEKNFPLLRNTLSSYRSQIVKAVYREDWVSINHRIAALLASYFDVLFAVNTLPHPGEKRLLRYAEATCELLPERMKEQVERVLQAASSRGDILGQIDTLLDDLEDLLDQYGLNSR